MREPSENRNQPLRRCPPRWARALLAVLLVCVPTIWGAGCAAIIHPPRDLADPARVYLMAYGYHASLVLPTDEEKWVEYAYGDWRYYAESRNSLLSGGRAFFFPTRGALGRGQLVAGSDGEAIDGEALPFFAWGSEALVFEVERERARALVRHLDADYERYGHTRLTNPAHGLDFVHHDRSYSLFHNCNTALARWLRELGCRTRGPVIFSRWKLRIENEQ